MKRQTLYIDCFAGIAGDMMLGALFDLGVPQDVVIDGLATLDIEGYELRITRGARHGIVGCDVRVLQGDKALDAHHASDHREHGADEDHPREPNTDGHHHHHGHDHHGHDHHHHGHDHHHHGPSRQWKDIRTMLQSASLPDGARRLALAMFERLAIAEAKLHGVSPEVVHFHEVGGIDAIVDIVGTALAIDWLEPCEIVSSPVPAPRGFVRCEHGRMPLPAPATMELLQGVRVIGTDETGEWVTPTGATILSTLAERYEPIPPMTPTAIGYGVGDRDTPTHANLLRLILGESARDVAGTEPIVELEATLDDMVPEWFGALTARLRDNNALDCWLTPVHMKKGRPGTVLTVLGRPQDTHRLLDIIFRESTTLGVRINHLRRAVAARDWTAVDTQYGTVRIKLARHGDDIVTASPEYEDCRRQADEHAVPVKRVYRAAITRYQEVSSETE